MMIRISYGDIRSCMVPLSHFFGGYFDKSWAPFLFFFSNVYIFCLFILLLLEGTDIGGALDW